MIKYLSTTKTKLMTAMSVIIALTGMAVQAQAALSDSSVLTPINSEQNDVDEYSATIGSAEPYDPYSYQYNQTPNTTYINNNEIINSATGNYPLASETINESAPSVNETASMDFATQPTIIPEVIEDNVEYNNIQTDGFQPMVNTNIPVAPMSTSTNGISQQIFAHIVTMVEGQEQISPIADNTQLQTGDVIEYQVEVSNVGKDRVGSMMVNLSIPNEVEFIGQTSPSLAMGSLDSVDYYYMPIKSRINGVLQNMPLDKYQSLRWQVENLNMGETTVVKYRAMVK